MMLDPDMRCALDGTSLAHLARPPPARRRPPLRPGLDRTDGDHVAVLAGPGTCKARNLRRDPRVALSLTSADNPFQPIIIRGRVIEWLEGDRAWEIIDRISTKYIGGPYSRSEDRVVALIEPDRQSMG